MPASTEAHMELNDAITRCLEEGDTSEEIVEFVDMFIADWKEETDD